VSESGAGQARWVDAGSMPWQAAGLGELTAKPLVMPSPGGVYVGFTRFPRGGEIPHHRHVGDEFIYVTEGLVEDDGGTLWPGWASYRPVGCTHSVRSAEGATVLVVATGTSVPASATEKSRSSHPLAPPTFARSASQAAGVAGAELFSVPAPDGGAARRALLLQVAAGSALDLPQADSERVCLIIEGRMTQAWEGGAGMGPSWFCRLRPLQDASAVAMLETTLLLIEWADCSPHAGTAATKSGAESIWPSLPDRES